MKKQDVIELFTSFENACDSKISTLSAKIESEQSADEVKALKTELQKYTTKAKWIKRVTQHEALFNEVAGIVAQLKLKEEQLTSVVNDSYSIGKFVLIMRAFAQKMKLSERDDNALDQFICNYFTSFDGKAFNMHEIARKMKTLNGSSYTPRQAQMCATMLERLGAFTAMRDGRTKVYQANADSAVMKRLVALYE